MATKLQKLDRRSSDAIKRKDLLMRSIRRFREALTPSIEMKLELLAGLRATVTFWYVDRCFPSKFSA